jgi:hypothetical protein
VPGVPTKSGLMVGLGETDDEILQVMRDMRAHGIDMLTIGQYLAPSGHHLPVRRYVHPDTFKMFEREARPWASAMPPWARWCAAATTPTSRRAISSLCLALIAPSAIEARASCPKPAMASDWDLRNGRGSR